MPENEFKLTEVDHQIIQALEAARKTKILQGGPSGEERGLHFNLPNGKPCYIATHDVSFFRQLQQLPGETKIALMMITEDDLTAYFSKKRKSENEILKEILSQKWFFRDTGDPMDYFDPEWIPQVNKTLEDITKRTNSKRPLPLDKIRIIIEWFTKPNSEVYQRENTAE